MCGEHKFSLKEDFDMLCRARDMRNKLSYWDIVDYEELAAIAGYEI